MIISDFHTHTWNSGDSDTPMKEQIEAAVRKGIMHLCFTEHMDLDYPPVPEGVSDENFDFFLDIDKYRTEYEEMQTVYSGDKNKINLYFGIELGLQSHIAKENREIIKSHPFDFVIASSHVLHEADPYYPVFWEGKKEDEVIRSYFASIYENICGFRDFDVYGHLDYIVRYGKEKGSNFKYDDYRQELDAILKKLIEMGKGIELNTGGLRHKLKYPNPNPEILKRYRELGGEIITVGSDAHKSEHIALCFAVAEELLKECGFKYYTIFRKRTPEFIKL